LIIISGEKQMNIYLEKVDTNKKNVLWNLLQLYLHDITSINFSGIEMDKNGIYPYPDFDYYWSNNDFFPYFIKMDNEIVGFVLLTKNFSMIKNAPEKNCYIIQEMFILNRYKRKGIGKNVVLQLFNKYIGKWEIGTLPNSKDVTIFWEKIIGEYTENKFTGIYQGYSTPIFIFENYENKN
jgi:predicted acetyltransferase